MAKTCEECLRFESCAYMQDSREPCDNYADPASESVDGLAGGAVESDGGPAIPARIVVAQSLDALSHGNIQGSVQQAVSGKSILPLPCGVGLILDDSGRVVGSGEPRGHNAITCSRVIVNRIEGIEATMREASNIFHEIGNRIGELEKRCSAMEESKGRMVSKVRDQLVQTVNERVERSGTSLHTQIRAEIKRECEGIWQQCKKLIHMHRAQLRAATRNNGCTE